MLVTSVLFWTLTWQWVRILTTSLVLPHLLSRRSAVSGNILMGSLVKNSFLCSYLLAVTIVIVYSSTSPIRIFANFNVSKTHLPALLLSQKTGSHHTNLVWPPLVACHSPHKLQSSSAYIQNSLRYGTCLHVWHYTSLCSYKDTKLRSSSSNLLQMPSARTITYGERAFSIRAPRLEFSAAKHQASWIGWSLQGTLKTISVQTGTWLVTHSFIVFCSSLIIFVTFMYFLCCSLSYSLALYVLCLLRIEMSVVIFFAPYKHRVLLILILNIAFTTKHYFSFCFSNFLPISTNTC